jgi:hypothetical protein
MVQIISEPRPVALELTDLSTAPDPRQEAERALVTEIQRPMDPEAGTLRVALWRLGEREHVLCIVVHHLVADAWACGLISRDMGLLYNRLVVGGPPLPDVGWQYAYWAESQREMLDGPEYGRHLPYWKTQLDGVQPPILPKPATRSEISARRTAVERLDIDRSVVTRLQDLAREHHTTLFTVMLCLYYAALTRFTDQDDIAVASMFANRLRREIQQTVGFLASVVVLRARLDRANTFNDLVQQVHKTVVDAFVHQELPYHLLPAGTVQLDGARADDVMFQMLPEPVYQTRMYDLVVEPISILDGLGARWDLELTLAPWDRGFKTLVLYAEDRFSRDWARGLIETYADLAARVSRDPALAVRPVLA